MIGLHLWITRSRRVTCIDGVSSKWHWHTCTSNHPWPAQVALDHIESVFLCAVGQWMGRWPESKVAAYRRLFMICLCARRYNQGQQRRPLTLMACLAIIFASRARISALWLLHVVQPCPEPLSLVLIDCRQMPICKVVKTSECIKLPACDVLLYNWYMWQQAPAWRLKNFEIKKKRKHSESTDLRQGDSGPDPDPCPESEYGFGLRIETTSEI